MDAAIGSPGFEAQNELEVDLVRAAHEPSHREAFLRELLDATVYLALLPDGGRLAIRQDGRADIGPDARLELAPVMEEGGMRLPFFSSPGRARSWYRADHVVAQDRVRTLLARHPDTAFCLNPGSDYRLDLDPEDIRSLLRGDLTAH